MTQKISFLDWVNSFPETQEEATERFTLTKDQVEKIAAELLIDMVENKEISDE